MKYKAVIETDDIENFEFFEDGNGKYLRGIDAGAVNNEWIALYFTECKQEPVLDKIIAEIEEHVKINQCLNTDRAKALCWCLDVIDKHIAESVK